MKVRTQYAPRFALLGLLLLLLVLSNSMPGNGQVVPRIPSLQENALRLTVQPDRNVGVSWNTSTSLASIAQNFTSLFPAGYSIHSESSFSKQANAVVQTSTVQYQLPEQLVIQTPLSNVNSISFTSTTAGTARQSSLRIDTNPAIILPIDNISLNSTSDLTHVRIDASAQLYFFTSFTNTSLWYLANQTAFQSKWDATFGNTTWTTSITARIQNATRYLVTVTTLTGSITSTSSSARVSVSFEAVPSTPLTDFVAVIEQLLSAMAPVPMGIDSIIRSALTLETSSSSTLTYTGSTRTVVSQSTTNYVADLDSQVNRLKNQFSQLLFSTWPAGTPIPAQLLFLNSTSLTISQISTSNDVDFNLLTSKMSVRGLFFRPPTVGPNTNFTIPGLFQTIGTVPAPGLNITLAGGSNATHTVRVIIPSGVPTPNSATASSATWTSLQAVSSLSQVHFSVERLPGSLADLLLSPPAIAVEAIAALAAVVGIVLFLRRRRVGPTPPPFSEPGPTPTSPPTPP